jgi:hypothetical protein
LHVSIKMLSRLANFITWLYLSQTQDLISCKYFEYPKDFSRIGKCFSNDDQRDEDQADAVFTLFKDNSAILQSCGLETLGRSISTIYPPPTAKEVIQICFNSNMKRMFLLLVSGTLCIYRVDRDTAILEKLQYPSMIKDSEGK